VRIESRSSVLAALALVAVVAAVWGGGCARPARVERATVTYYYLPG
jgi:hypothetical protein